VTRLAAIALAALLCATGCTENAALKIILDLPPSRTEMTMMGMAPRQFAFVQIRRAADNPFEVDWDGRDLDPIQLQPPASPATSPPTPRTVDEITILTDDDSVDLNLKIRFCIDPGCNGFEDQPAPSVWFAIEHPFYIGETTEWSATMPNGMPVLELEEMPAADPMMISDCDPAACSDFECTPAQSMCDVNFVDACQVRGCVSGDASPSGYCRMSGDMAHFCQGE
jgi:hypothetical protein